MCRHAVLGCKYKEDGRCERQVWERNVSLFVEEVFFCCCWFFVCLVCFFVFSRATPTNMEVPRLEV